MVYVVGSHAPVQGDLKQVNLYAEQLDLAARPIRQGGVARARMALVAVDNLAEVLLYRHMQFTFAASESTLPGPPKRRYSQRNREQLRRDFDRRVTLATRDEFGFPYPQPILDDSDATVFRVAHRYRNGIYHEDRHNPTLVEPLARLYILAVGRTWCRSQIDMGSGGPTSRLKGLRYVRRHADDGYVTLRDAVEAISAEVLDDLEVEPKELAERLATDLVERADAIREAWRELTQTLLHPDAHAEMLRAAEFSYVHRADDELLRLQDEADDLMASMVQVKAGRGDRRLDAYESAVEAQRERYQELADAFHPQLRLRTASTLKTAAGRLRELRDADRLLARYETLDRKMGLLEYCLRWIDTEWDQYRSLQEDIARGK